MHGGKTWFSQFKTAMEKERAPNLARIHLMVRFSVCPSSKIHKLILN